MLQAQIYSLALTTCVGSPGQATQVESWLSYLYNFFWGGLGKSHLLSLEKNPQLSSCSNPFPLFSLTGRRNLQDEGRPPLISVRWGHMIGFRPTESEKWCGPLWGLAIKTSSATLSPPYLPAGCQDSGQFGGPQFETHKHLSSWVPKWLQGIWPLTVDNIR